MLEQLILALKITLVGMSLVFIAIILLWGTMALMVRLFSGGGTIRPESEIGDEEMKIKAALVAVSVALAQEKCDEPHEFPLPPTAIVSPWQGVMRSNMLQKRGPHR